MANIPQEGRPASELLKEWRETLDDYYTMMREFEKSPPDDNLRTLAGMSAYVSGVRTKIVRREPAQLKAFRTQEIDPFLYECDRQFKIWSRLIAVSKMEYDHARGF